MAQSGFGSEFQVGNGATPEVFTALARVISIDGPGVDVDDIEYSDNDSTDGWANSEAGIIKAGQVDLELNYDTDNTATIYALVGLPKNFKVVYPDGASWSFAGYLKSFGTTSPHDKQITQKITFKVNGKPTYVEAS